MGHLRFTDLQTRPLEVLDLTSLTLDEFRHLLPPFEAAFQAHMAQWRFDGRPRTARRYTTYQNCPLPTPEDRLLLYPGLPENLSPPGGAGAAVRDGPEPGQSIDSRPACGAAGHPAGPGGRPQPVLTGAGPAYWGDRGRSRRPGRADGGAIARGRTEPQPLPPPFWPRRDGTAHRAPPGPA